MKHLDSQRRELKEGQRVAYNGSGQVVPGIILKLGKDIQVAYKGNIPVYDYDWDKGYQPGIGYSKTERQDPISRVRNGSSILILGEENG